MPTNKPRTIIGFEVNPRMRDGYQKAFEKYDLSLSSALREALRRILDMSEDEQTRFAMDAEMNDTRDILIERGLWDKIKAIKSEKE